jgi:RNA polymerase sigma-70 factor (ECF subfamily)
MPTRQDGPASRTAAGPAEADDASVIAPSREEPAHFAEIFRRYAPEIQRYVVRRLGPGTAEDVVAETFLAAFRQRDGYDTSRACARPRR